MKEYRINVRFNMENETDRMIVAYLNRLRGTQKVSRNQFIINAIYEQIVEGNRNAVLMEQFRSVLREELSSISVSEVSEESTEPVSDFSFEVTDAEMEESKDLLRAGLEMFT